ncbi:MAG TPA: DNA methyltransferase [Terriglobales bacterium]|nr:DNA methyltransferase [Terriglobales bacterium]
MSIRILRGDVRGMLRTLEPDSIDCVITSPPYWGLRDYGVAGQIGMEPTLGEHIETLVDVFNEVRRVMKPRAAFWLNYGDCYATTPNGRSAAATKAAGNDDRTFRDKPFSTIGPVYSPEAEGSDRRGKSGNKGAGDGSRGRIHAGGVLKPKDLCLIPFRLAIALQEDGWWVRSRCIWGKPNGMPDSSGRYRPSVAHEEIFLLSKSGDIEYDFEAVKAPAAESSIARWDQDIEAQEGSDRVKILLDLDIKELLPVVCAQLPRP